ncbi:MAG: toxin-antitoxin system YwqK family antitoxin [Verrucomicrobiota bacterium]|nr:toxin-antitoxin system YwqK family antitoxin [Verrucomicrobiota bacterium]
MHFIRQAWCAPIAILLLNFGEGLAQEEGVPRKEPKPVLETQLTESKDGLILIKGEPYTGEVVKFYPNKKKSESYSIRRGRLHGPFVNYREDGSRAFQVTFADGVEQGPFKRWFEDGKIWVDENYKSGKLDGISLTYFSNGKIQVQSSYKSGKKEGLEIGWYENGKQRWEAIYEKGKLKNKLSWNPDGTPSGKKAPIIL